MITQSRARVQQLPAPVLPACTAHLPTESISLTIIAGVRLALKAAGKIGWHNRIGTPLGTLRRWMKICGFEEGSPWSWRMSGVWVTLCGSISSNLQKHSLRNGWKFFCWGKFLASGRHGRHAAVDIQSAPVNRASAFDWNRIRLVIHEASARSVLFFHDRDVDGNSDCGVPHLALGVSFAGVVLPPHLNALCVHAILLCHFGWLRERDSSEILRYMARVQHMIWNHR